MELSGCRVRRILLHREPSSGSQSRRPQYYTESSVDTVWDSDFSDSFTSDDELLEHDHASGSVFNGSLYGFT